jgi:hypothetical protein
MTPLYASFETFDQDYRPIYRDDEDFWERHQIPADADPHYWWTVLMIDGRFRLARGFHYANALGFIPCEVPWHHRQLDLPF